MKFYSYQGQEPQALPERIRLEDGVTVTGLNDLSDEELNSYGFVGPIEFPTFDRNTHKSVWNGSQYKVVELDSQELAEKERERIDTLTQNIDADHFLSIFKTTSFHSRIRKESALDLKVNVVYCELIAHLKSSETVRNFGDYLNKLFLIISFTKQEIDDLQGLLDRFSLNLIYTIPNEEYFSKHTYHFETDTIIDTKAPFASWIWDGFKWVAPVVYPNDRNSYTWNEKTKKWKKV